MEQYTIREVRYADHQAVCELIQSVDLPKQVFIKNDDEETMRIILDDRSICIYDGDKMLGFVLVTQRNYIDTIISTKPGLGKQLLNALPPGKYMTHCSPMNNRSQALFTKAGFVHKETGTLYGEVRFIYVGTL